MEWLIEERAGTGYYWTLYGTENIGFVRDANESGGGHITGITHFAETIFAGPNIYSKSLVGTPTLSHTLSSATVKLSINVTNNVTNEIVNLVDKERIFQKGEVIQ